MRVCGLESTYSQVRVQWHFFQLSEIGELYFALYFVLCSQGLSRYFLFAQYCSD